MVWFSLDVATTSRNKTLLTFVKTLAQRSRFCLSTQYLAKSLNKLCVVATLMSSSSQAPFARLYASKLNDGSSASQNAPSTFES